MFRLRVAATFICLLAVTTDAVNVQREAKPLDLDDDPYALEFETYQKQHSRTYDHGSDEYWHRRGLFEKRNAAVKEHNARSDRLWEAVAGMFADWTEAERSRMLGYRRDVTSPTSGGNELPSAAAKERELLRPIQGNATLPDKFDWMHLRQARMVPDQQSCGSCWAVASKSTLEAHYEIHVAKTAGALRNFSAQQIVTCVPNPRECGGTGGCSGSTVELAFDWVLHSGCATEHDVPYQARDLSLDEAKCNESEALSGGQGGLIKTGDSPNENGIVVSLAGSAFGMHGWQKLEVNKEGPLMQALYHHGPVATSTAAGPWFEYQHGIFDGCPKDTVVDHAVTLYGYGEADVAPEPLTNVVATGHTIGFSNSLSLKGEKVKYWLIRNSWGAQWGEKGFIRMKRVGDGHCGADNDNYEGTGCAKADPTDPTDHPADPTNVTVCGMCGFLWDSVVPLFSNGTHPAGDSVNSSSGIEVEASAKAHFVRREKF
jgi:cathepsin L